jgi:hypothetical protein
MSRVVSALANKALRTRVTLIVAAGTTINFAPKKKPAVHNGGL